MWYYKCWYPDPFTAVEAVHTFTEMRFSEWDTLPNGHDRSGSALDCKLRPKQHHHIIFKTVEKHFRMYIFCIMIHWCFAFPLKWETCTKGKRGLFFPLCITRRPIQGWNSHPAISSIILKIRTAWENASGRCKMGWVGSLPSLFSRWFAVVIAWFSVSCRTRKRVSNTGSI